MTDLTIFTAVDSQRYEKFICPFIFFPLHLNDNVQVEVHVWNAEDYIFRHGSQVALLETKFKGRFVIKEIDRKHWAAVPSASAYRFYAEPTLKSKWTKISDVDIMHIDEDPAGHFERLESEFGKDIPYFALQRSHKPQLSGTYCVKTNDFYTDAWRKNRDEVMSHYKETDAFALKLGPFEVPVAFDEYVNWGLVTPVHGEPFKSKGNEERIRPIQGIHMSLNRPPYPYPWQPDRPAWDITDERKKKWEQFKASEDYYTLFYLMTTPEIIKMFDKI